MFAETILSACIFRQERQTEKSLVPPAPAAVPKTAPSQRQEIGGQETATKPVVTSASPPQGQRSAWGTSLPQGQRSFWDTFPPQLQRPRAKPETLIPPAAADVPRAASSQNEGIGGQETSTEPPFTPPSPPQKESSTKTLESRAPPAPAAVPKTGKQKNHYFLTRNIHRTSCHAGFSFSASSQQETTTEAPITPASPPQQESPAQRLDEPDPVKSEPLVPPVDAAVPKTAPGDAVDTPKVSKKARRRIRKMTNASSQQETTTEAPITPASPPQQESPAQRLDEPDPVKSEPLVPPVDAAVPKTAPGDAVDTPKVSKKARRRIRKMTNAASSQQETTTEAPITPASPPQQESPAQRLDEPDPVKSEPLVPPVDAAVPKTAVLKRQEIAGEETQRQEANDTDTSVEDLCERLEEVHLSSNPPARATQSPVPERHSFSPFNPLKPLHPATFVFEIPSTLAEIEYFCEQLNEFHLSTKPPAAAHRPSPVPEHQLGSNSSSSFNPLKPLRPAKFIFESSFDIEHLRKLLEEVHLSSKAPAAPRPSPVPECHHLGSSNIHGASSFNRLKPLRPAKFLFESPSAFGFGQEQKSDCQMSGQERSIEPPVTADPRTTPFPSQGPRSALKPEDHAPVGYASPKVSRAARKEKRKMRKTKKDFQKRQEANGTLETVEHLCGLLDGLHLSTKPSAPATPSSVPQ
ncbi:histone-lysine N-methyltransferase 2D-like [Triplophysa rosa]|uniref:histone-lysine N-methyltransferase 2D-like n=1 Tax=Triplophysa rosa TaxID=992332 RepID=UPI0025462AE6|nr:histone-lysine N-methyltransferase 2D-like [Triplophysa rosa]